MSSLPLTDDATIKDRAGTTLATTRARVWRTSASAGEVGQEYSYDGVCGSEAVSVLVGERNRIIEVGAETYRVVDAIHHPTLDYIELTLRQVQADG